LTNILYTPTIRAKTCDLNFRAVSTRLLSLCLAISLAAYSVAGFAQRASFPTTPIANFTDVAEKAGLTMQEIFGGIDTKKYIIETTGNWRCIFDYETMDGRDIFLVNGPGLERPHRTGTQQSSLIRNNHEELLPTWTAGPDLPHWLGARRLRWRLRQRWLGRICNITYYGKKPAHHNQGGVFTEVAEKAGVAGSGKSWGTGCAFVDYDRRRPARPDRSQLCGF